MKVTTMMKMKSKFNHALFIAILATGVTGCFDSNSEEPAPDVVTDGGGGGGGTTPTTAGVDDELSVPVGSTGGTVDVLRNDSDGVQLASFETTSAQGGTVSREGTTGKLTYVPESTYSGADNFTYTIQDLNGDTSTVTVNVTVDDAIISSGRDYFNKECGICHKAGAEDQQNAFSATDLVQSTNNFDYDMSLSDQVWNPPLMRYYTSLSQTEVDGLRAYIGSLRNP